MTERVCLQPRFGNIIKRQRVKLGLSQAGLSARLRCSKQHVSALENGKEPGVQVLAQFSRALNLLPSAVLSDSLREEWGGWWGPVLDALGAALDADRDGNQPHYNSGYDDALLDACEALDRHAQAWRQDKGGYDDVPVED